MKNTEIANHFGLLAKIMELHGENPFKIRSYSSAYQTIRKLPDELADMEVASIQKIPGLGKAIAEKTYELARTGSMAALNKYLDMTPEGIVELLGIKGLGPKRIKTIWSKLEITDPAELLYACTENRLLSLKGFGPKVQADLVTKLKYHIASKGKMLYAEVLPIHDIIISALNDQAIKYDIGGDVLEKNPVVNSLKYIVEDAGAVELPDGFLKESEGNWKSPSGMNIVFVTPSSENLYADLLATLEEKDAELNPALAEKILPALWWMGESAETIDTTKLITDEHIKGVIHNHTTYSDGLHTLNEMAERSRALGYEYMVITDHSKAAFYAGGLSIDRVYQQVEEIKKLNEQWDDFKLLTGTECDIMSDGSMDYPDELLAELDVVIASIHSNLNMPMDKAMHRLLTAIAHPHVDILGHMTGRLLLSRKGYPVDHATIIDSCAEHGVSIEINANPRRLDMDYRWIPYAIEKGVMISINPDAHSIKGIEDIHYGVLAARKGGLYREQCLNCLGADELKNTLKTLKTRALTNR